MALLEGRRQEVDRIPALCAARTYIKDAMEKYDAYWPESHKDPDKMAKLAAGVYRLTGNENISVPFEMTLEAEAIGAPLDFFEGRGKEVKWVNVKDFIAEDVSDMKLPEDPSKAGRIPVLCEAIRILKKEFEGKVPVMGILNAPFTSISSYIVEPTQFLKWIRTKPEKVKEFVDAATDTYAGFANAFKDAGADVIVITEEGVSLDNISPKAFDRIIKPYLSKLIGLIEPPIILHTCGQLISREKPDIETMSGLLECGGNALSIEERTPLEIAIEIRDKIKPDLPIGGNINAFTVIFEGPIEKIRESVKQVIEKRVDMVMPGCDYWLETPSEHIKAFVDATIEFGTPPYWKK